MVKLIWIFNVRPKRCELPLENKRLAADSRYLNRCETLRWLDPKITREHARRKKNLGKFIRKFNLAGRVRQPILISCDEECCNGVPINLGRDFFFRASGSPSERSVPQAELFSCIENSRQQGRAPRWMRVFDKKGSTRPSVKGPSQSRQIAFDPSLANASESIKSWGWKMPPPMRQHRSGRK